MILRFPDLKDAQDSVLRNMYQAQKERFADRWAALALDARYSKNGPETVMCFARLGNEFWLRDSGVLKQAEELQFAVPQRFSLLRTLKRLAVG